MKRDKKAWETAKKLVRYYAEHKLTGEYRLKVYETLDQIALIDPQDNYIVFRMADLVLGKLIPIGEEQV